MSLAGHLFTFRHKGMIHLYRGNQPTERNNHQCHLVFMLLCKKEMTAFEGKVDNFR